MSRKMYSKLQALLRILYELECGKAVNKYTIMDELEVSERSAYRYINDLVTAGFPIYYDARRGSYRFIEGFGLRKVG